MQNTLKKLLTVLVLATFVSATGRSTQDAPEDLTVASIEGTWTGISNSGFRVFRLEIRKKISDSFLCFVSMGKEKSIFKLRKIKIRKGMVSMEFQGDKETFVERIYFEGRGTGTPESGSMSAKIFLGALPGDAKAGQIWEENFVKYVGGGFSSYDDLLVAGFKLAKQTIEAKRKP